jgi:hypothetical protein
MVLPAAARASASAKVHFLEAMVVFGQLTGDVAPPPA